MKNRMSAKCARKDFRRPVPSTRIVASIQVWNRTFVNNAGNGSRLVLICITTRWHIRRYIFFFCLPRNLLVISSFVQIKPHRCSVCPKSFPTPGDLRSHMYVHSGTWPFRCSICFRGFSKQTNLKNHFLLHSGKELRVVDRL